MFVNHLKNQFLLLHSLNFLNILQLLIQSLHAYNQQSYFHILYSSKTFGPYMSPGIWNTSF